MHIIQLFCYISGLYNMTFLQDNYKQLHNPCVLHSRTLLIQMLVIQITNYPDWLGPSGKFVENSTKLT